MNLSKSLKTIIVFFPLTILILERTTLSFKFLLQGPINSNLPLNKVIDSFTFGVPEENSSKDANAQTLLRPVDLKGKTREEKENIPDAYSNDNIGKFSNGKANVDITANHFLRPVDLKEITREEKENPCGKGEYQIENNSRSRANSTGSIHADNRNHRIPRIVHQTFRSRCVTPPLFHAARNWRQFGDDWEYYFHSDEAIDRLFQMSWPEFPHLSNLLPCLMNKGTLKADLWRYLVLWEYGGVYADIDTKPNLFNTTTITAKDDGFFVVEQYHMLSQYFMAVSPKHPIMFYTIHSVLSKLLNEKDTGGIYAPYTTGPHALNTGFQHFMKDKGVTVTDGGAGKKPAKAGLWVGTNDRSITVAGVGENENEFVIREYIRSDKKLKSYHAMGIEHFSKDMKKSGKSCMQILWDTQADSLKKLGLEKAADA